MIVAVEYHRACAFEELLFVFVSREVYLLAYGKTLRSDTVEYLGATLGTTIGSKHRIQHHTSAGMERYPIIREYAVGSVGLGSIFHYDNVDFMCSEHIYHRAKLCQSIMLNLCLGGVVVLLEIVVFRCLFVKAKQNRLYHKDIRCCLHNNVYY